MSAWACAISPAVSPMASPLAPIRPTREAALALGDELSVATSASAATSEAVAPSSLYAQRHASEVSDRPATKRTNAISWDEMFMAVAFVSSMRSKDPSTQVGACIVDAEQHIVGVGYNGFPIGCSDDELPWARASPHGELETKYPYVCHAEMNAIMNRNAASTRGCRIYVALFPCNECTKLIIQAGIVEVIYCADKYHDTPAFQASRRMLDMAGVVYRRFVPVAGREEIVVRFNSAGK
jgi:dCMP deaminase